MSPEFELIRRFFTKPARRAVLGVGDDCALWQAPAGMHCAVSTDMLVEGTHFVRGADPGKLGHKALAVNLSDLAAMGAEPACALLALALPSIDHGWLEAFARGFLSLAERHGVDLVGGDTTRGPLAVCVTVIGHVPSGRALRRDGARAGDDVWLSGATGDAALALAHAQGSVRLDEGALLACAARLDAPDPRVGLGIGLRELAHSAIDVSDGLVADLGHIAQASRVDIDLHAELLPASDAVGRCTDRALALRCQAAGGDDYELAFTAPAARRDGIESVGRELGLALTRIGEAKAGGGTVVLRDPQGAPIALGRPGWDHFAP